MKAGKTNFMVHFQLLRLFCPLKVVQNIVFCLKIFCFQIKITASQETQGCKSSSPWVPKYAVQEKVTYPVTATESTEYPIAPFRELV